MKIADKTKEQLIEELEALRLRTAELERTEAAHKRKEEAIRRLEEEKLSILNRMSEHVVYQNSQHRILWANKAAAEAADLTREQLVGCYCYQVWPKRSEPCVNCPVAKARETGKPQTGEMTTPDGRVWFVQGYPIRDTEDQIVGLVEVTLEVTERKQVEEALRKGERKYELLFESTLDGMFVLDAETMRVVLANQAAVDIYGLGSVEEAIGLNPLDCVPPEERERVLRIIVKDMFENDLRQVNEFRGITRDGREIWVSAVGTRTEYRGKLAGLISFSDVTERKQAEEALRESEKFNASLLENAPNPVLVMNPDTSIRYVNPALERLTGYTFGEIIGNKQPRPWWVEGKTQEAMDRIWQRLPKGGQSMEEVLFQKKNGEQFWVNLGISRIERDGELSYILVNWVDITERKKAEEALQAEKNKLQSVVDAIEYGLTIVDRDYNIIYQKELLRGIFGVHVGEKCYRAYESRDTVCDGCPVEKAFKDGKSHTSDRKVELPSGEVFFWENTANPIKDAEGKIISCLEVTRDITQRKKAEEALRESEEEKGALLEEAPIAIINVDLKGKITYVNKRFESESGYSREEIVGKNGLQLDWLPAGTIKYLVKRMAARLGGRPSKHWETQFKCKDERWIWVEVEGKVLRKFGVPVGFQIIARDITERKQAEEALQQNREELRKMFESVTDGISVINLSGIITDVNQRTVEMHGFSSRDEILGKSALELVAPADHERVAANMRKALTQGVIRSVEYTLLKADGSEFPGELSTNVLKDASGKAIGHITIARDITERKEVEEKRQAILKTALDGFWMISLEGKFLEVNDSYCKMVGYARDELLKMSIADIEAVESPEEVAQRIKKITAQGYDCFETRHKCKDGKIIDVEVSVNYLDVGGGQFFVFARDITERKRAEEELKLRAQILDSATDSIFVHDADDNFIYVNEAACRTHGYSREEFMKMKLPQIVNPERARSLGSDRQEVLEKGYIVTESVHLRKDGSIMPVEVHARTIESGGGKLFLNVVRDITERKRMEEEREEIEQKAHLASRLASVGEMASGIAHEINNPLTSVIGFSQLLMEGDIPADVKEDISIIYKEAQRAAGVAKNLLTFARKQAPAKQPTNINSIIEGVLKLRAYEHRVNNIKVDSQLAPDLPEVMADYSQLQQVFINLIINAESAMIEANKGGTLTITTQKINKTVRASFSDDGPGITKENLNRIFDPFFTTKEVGKGTGLGLSVCHGIVAEHNGRIYARSKLGRGATFVVELPVNNS